MWHVGCMITAAYVWCVLICVLAWFFLLAKHHDKERSQAFRKDCKHRE